MSDARIPSRWRHLVEGADHVDIKTGEGPGSVKHVAAGILAYEPFWMAVLWRARKWLVRILGLGKQPQYERYRFNENTLPDEPGQKVAFFTVMDSDGETFWIVDGRESHLEAVLAVFREPIPGRPGVSRFNVMTVVRYRSKVGPIYFNLIRPFHHLLIICSMRNALKRANQDK